MADLDQEINEHYRQGAGRLVAALLGKVASEPAMAEAAERIRQEAAVPLRAAQARPLQVRLLCGLVLPVFYSTTSYVSSLQGVAATELGLGTMRPREPDCWGSATP
jgi:hypothetical protein